jgi:fructuronate reductase
VTQQHAPSDLSRDTLSRLAPAHRPLVDPRELRPRTVHFGPGAFHRAHQALYTETAAARSGAPWGIVAVAPRSAGTAAALRAQDCLYSVTDRAPGGARTRVVGALVDALTMRPDADRVDALLASPEVTTVTLTVTEKGYARDADTGGLDAGAAGIVADLAATGGTGTADMVTVVGRLAASLAVRFRGPAAPLSVVSCDNAAGNGAALARVVREFVERSAWPDRRALLDWLAAEVAFPDTVVDRIVPATTGEDREAAAAALGLRDALPVAGEPYRQWVLQDSFRAERPPWEHGGALFVPDVAPYQLTKLRLLNGAHSAMAYLGAAAGCRTVAEVMETEWGERLVRAYCAEVAPTLPPGGPDPARYTDDLVERFRNPAMRHLLRQIGSDGSLKIPERWMGPLRALRVAGAATPVLELALAAWVAATRPGADGGQVHGTTDPAAEALARCGHAGDPASVVGRLLTTIGAADLAGAPDLVAAVAARLPALRAGRVEL